MKHPGEGVNRMLGLAFSWVCANNGLLMGDEIETGVHYLVQTARWCLVLAAVHPLNVQVFAATDSSDYSRSFAQATREDVEGVRIRLQERRGGSDFTING